LYAASQHLFRDSPKPRSSSNADPRWAPTRPKPIRRPPNMTSTTHSLPSRKNSAPAAAHPVPSPRLTGLPT